MRVAVIGAGAMGCAMAYLLQAGGMEVVLYERRRERVAEIAEKGIRLRGDLEAAEAFDVRLPGEPVEPFDFFVLAVPVGESGEAVRPLSPYVHRETLYLSLQEGSAVEGLALLVGEERAGGAVAEVSAVELGGVVEVEEFRRLVMGGFRPGQESGFAPLAQAVEKARPGGAMISGDLEGDMWRRLVSAAAVSGLCAVLGSPPLEIAGREEVRSLCLEAAGEAAALAAEKALALSPESPWEGAVWRTIQPPLLRDLEAGRRTEIDVLSGRIVKEAGKRKARASVHSAVASLVREMESGRRKPGEGAFKELVRRVREEKGMSLL